MSDIKETNASQEDLKTLRDDYDQLVIEYKKQQIQLNHLNRQPQNVKTAKSQSIIKPLKKTIKDILKKNPKVDYYSKRILKKLRIKR